jgi:hypothetical protein
VLVGFREECDHTGRRVVLHPAIPSDVSLGMAANGPEMAAPVRPGVVAPGTPRRLLSPPPGPPERPARGECWAPGCHKEVRRAGDRFCGAPECREWAVQARRARAQERARERYLKDPKAANQLRAAQARAKRARDRRARTVRRFCFVDSHPFTTDDPTCRVCDDPEHRAAWRRDRWCRASARYRRRHRTPKRLHIRTKPYRGRARYLTTEDFAIA